MSQINSESWQNLVNLTLQMFKKSANTTCNEVIQISYFQIWRLIKTTLTYIEMGLYRNGAKGECSLIRILRRCRGRLSDDNNYFLSRDQNAVDLALSLISCHRANKYVKLYYVFSDSVSSPPPPHLLTAECLIIPLAHFHTVSVSVLRAVLLSSNWSQVMSAFGGRNSAMYWAN